MEETEKKPENVISSITSKATLPISFDQFSKDPVKGLLFIVILAIGYLYADGKFNYTNQIEKHENKIEVLETKVDNLSTQLKRSDSAFAVAITKLEILTNLGKIK
jgi:hypothetical protein